ncbi:glycoside hydrolase family 79 protein [Tulasnella calospora MUT 4182]|uniref:Glycoside hydrolase family 79 protein n=1 Tax=Tulasnella calospora MUT 4182 TaxID=1051891 RepID=A0A0C3Q563_9AGAM|nr:glycoside hydrolase family 79 protein [Tulasnella calospora MUT 4182]
MLKSSVIFTLLSSLATPFASAAVTVYTASSTTTADLSLYTVASNDQTILQVPAAPADQAGTVLAQLYDGGMTGMGNPVNGGFLGFSVELSVAAMLSEWFLRPEFLNYCAVLESRGGSVTVRVGGNTQDKAILAVDGNPSGKTIDKYKGTDASPTETPDVHFTLDIFYAMASISKLVKANWFFGIPFIAVDSDGNAGLVVQYAKQILGSNLLALQLANEPDLYGPHLKKQADYSEADFFADTQTMIAKLPITEPILAGPSICCMWDTNTVLNDGYLNFKDSLAFIDVMHYPNNNCATGADAVVPQDVFPNYLNHHNVQNVVTPYASTAQISIAAGKQMMMMETNTASCGGFPGVSDSFAASLWGVDYGLQMAYNNFTYALLHFGGQNVYYNPFTPPPTNMTKYRQWTTGAVFYANIVVAEALGKGGASQVIDLQLDNNNENRAGYAIYEKGEATRAVFINYVSNPGASDYTVQVAIGGQQTGLPNKTPTSVKVKYLRADSVSVKYNITWAGQTMGQQYASDGRLYGDAEVQTIQCDTTTQLCDIPVPSPSVALVFLTDEAFTNSGGAAGDATGSTLTFATTVTTGKVHATIDLAALATSNGRNGSMPLGATSKGGALSSWAEQGVRMAGGVAQLWWSVAITVLGVVGSALTM